MAIGIDKGFGTSGGVMGNRSVIAFVGPFWSYIGYSRPSGECCSWRINERVRDSAIIEVVLRLH